MTPAKFFDKWTKQKQQDLVDAFEKAYGRAIDSVAKSNCVPRQLLAAVIFNEQIDYGAEEAALEKFLHLGKSLGPAQLIVETIKREKVWEEGYYESWMERHGNEQLELVETGESPVGGLLRDIGDYATGSDRYRCLGERLFISDPLVNIALAVKLLAHYLGQKNTVTKSFQMDVGKIPKKVLEKICCGNCEEVVKMKLDGELLRTLAAMWNNGPKILAVKDVRRKSRGAYTHASNAAGLVQHFK